MCTCAERPPSSVVGMQTPTTRRDDTVETVHGHVIADPYRWLEDPDSPETAAWVEAQNAVSRDYLAGLGAQEYFSDLLRRILLRPSATAPLYRSGWYLVSRNDGSAPQNTWYVARTLDELQTAGRVLFEPSTWSTDGTTSLSTFTIDPSGRLGACARSEGGSDWQIVSVIDMATGDVVEQDCCVTKFSELAWVDDTTFLYSHYADSRATGTSTHALPGPQLMTHTVGGATPDRLVLEFPDDPHASPWVATSSDGAWIAVTITRGTEDKAKLWLYRVGAGGELGDPIKVLDTFEDAVSVVDVIDDVLYLVTDQDAPRSRIVSLDLSGLAPASMGELPWRTVVPETEGTLAWATVAGDVIITEHLEDASPVLRRWQLDGEELGRLPIEGGMIVAISGRHGRDEALITVNSVTNPVQSLVVTPSTGEVRELSFAPPGSWRAPEVSTTRHRATSADGTAVPYWLLRRADAPQGPLPTIMYGYGGFNVAMGAWFSPAHIAWIEAGGAVAVANLRGGGEFGTQWYEQGKREYKQNVFDDFAAVAHHLVESGASTRDQLAALGGSNGGLLVGALITQHPELVAAAAPLVGVLDLLRFHKFTIGAAWISDYGDPDVADDFEVAFVYSPVHNITEGTHYPATLVVTGDHDDRVVPAHSHKFTATLQRAQGGDAPVLTRIETSTGHGAGKPKAVLAQEIADVLAFFAEHTGLQP